MRRHPLVAYFALAFAGTWALFFPVALSRRGLGVLPVAFPPAAVFVLYFLATYAGPFLSAFVVTAATDGKPGVRQLLRRMRQWRVGVRWYLVILAGYPLVFLVGLTPLLGTQPLAGLVQRWPLLLSVYLPNILIGLILPALGEETGWRGFALPRLEAQYGALGGSLILGSLHALWHLPAYLAPGFILSGPFDMTVFVANSLAILAATLIWTWVVNNAQASILIAMLVHATSNATSALIPKLLPALPDDPWGAFKILGGLALLIVVLTRGRLAYRRAVAQPGDGLQPAAVPLP
jgi:membrane protease YdiL (CAAX protease family)